MDEKVAIGIDIGGTSTKMGLVTASGRVILRADQLTPHNLPGEVILREINARLAGLVIWARENGVAPLGIGVSLCGYLTPDGQCADYVNLHALDHLPIAAHFREAFGFPVLMDNDMNCAVLGEYLFGGGQGVDRLMVMTVGTGVGMAVILDGEVVRNSAGTVGNPGHTIVSPEGPVCVAGCRGCLESLASAGPIARRAEDLARSQRSTLLAETLARKGTLSPEDLHQAAEAGDISAQEVWEETGRWLGRGLATWVEIFTPHVVIVGGGVAQAGHWLIEPLEGEMRRCGEPYFASRVQEVKLSQLGKDVAMLGAASFFLYPEHAPRWSE